MSMRSCQRTKHVPMDAEVVTHWPTVYVVVGLTLVFLVGPLAAAIWFDGGKWNAGRVPPPRN